VKQKDIPLQVSYPGHGQGGCEKYDGRMVEGGFGRLMMDDG